MIYLIYREIQSTEEDCEKRLIYSVENKQSFLRGNFVLFGVCLCVHECVCVCVSVCVCVLVHMCSSVFACLHTVCGYPVKSGHTYTSTSLQFQ